MSTLVVPVYGALVQFGTGTAWVFDDAYTAPTAYAFTARSSNIAKPSRKRRRAYAYHVNAYNPVDLLAGGRAQRDSNEVQWTYHLVAPEGYTDAQGAYFIERNITVLETLIGATNDDGTSAEIQTLTVKAYHSDGSGPPGVITQVDATCTAALVDVDWDATTRGPFYAPLVVTFALFSEFMTS